MPGTNADARRAARHRRRRSVAPATACSSSRPSTPIVPVAEWPWMRELARRHRSAGQRQPQPARPGARGVARGAAACSTRPTPTVCRSYAQVAGRIDRHPATACTAASTRCCSTRPTPRSRTCRCAERLVALADPERRRRIVHDVPDDGGLFAQGGARPTSAASGRSTTATSTTSPSSRRSRSPRVAGRTGTPPMELVLDQLLAHDGNGMLYAPFFNYAYGDLSMTYEAHAAPAHADGAQRCRRTLRRDLRRRHADVHAHPLDPRPHAAARAAARVRRAPPDAADGRAVRPRRSWARRTRACAPTST